MSIDTPRFSDYALGSFDPKVVIELLRRPEPAYFALNDILFAGLSAWTVSPNRQHLVEEAMVLAGVSRMADLEDERQTQFPQSAFTADILARLTGPGVDFYQDYYYPVGGLRRVLQARSPLLLRRSLAAASREISFAVEMMHVCHYHAVRLRDRHVYRPASFMSGGEAVSGLLRLRAAKENKGAVSGKRRTVDGLNCVKKNAPFLRSASLIYAAHSISISKGTLLSAMREGTASFERHGHLIEEWIGRAIYIGLRVLEPMYTRQSSHEQNAYLPSARPIEFETTYSSEEGVIVEAAFAKRKSGKERVREDNRPLPSRVGG